MIRAPEDTIAAIASPPGSAARGILRLSGPDVRRCLEAVFRPEPLVDLAGIRRPAVILGSLCWESKEMRCVARTVPGFPASIRLPCELYFWPGRQSYTGQPTAEIHTLGARPLLEAALAQFCQAGARLAEPGEFTLRAFLAGRLDLTQAEAVLGVIDAADPAELEVALAQLAGGVAAPLHQLRDGLLDLLAHVEAGLDFADEDISFITAGELDRQLDMAAAAVGKLARQMASRTHRPERVRLVLVGSPNVGKSSLFNALLGREGALVSELPGTTRDYLAAELDFDGVPGLLIDTAGIPAEPHDGPDEYTTPLSASETASTPLSPGGGHHEVVGVGGEGAESMSPPPLASPDQAAQAAAARQQRQAQVTILCLDSTRPMHAWESPQLDETPPRRVVVLTKADLAPQVPRLPGAIRTSSVTGEGIAQLRAELARVVLEAVGSDAHVVAGTAVRCRESLRLAAESLQHARQIAQEARGEELVATELRISLDQLGKVVGAVYTDDVLDRIFSRFCIGK